MNRYDLNPYAPRMLLKRQRRPEAHILRSNWSFCQSMQAQGLIRLYGQWVNAKRRYGRRL